MQVEWVDYVHSSSFSLTSAILQYFTCFLAQINYFLLRIHLFMPGKFRGIVFSRKSYAYREYVLLGSKVK